MDQTDSNEKQAINKVNLEILHLKPYFKKYIPTLC